MSYDFEDVDMTAINNEVNRIGTEPKNALDFVANKYVQMPKKDGFVLMRILPPKKGNSLFCVTRTHRLNGKSFHCPRELAVNARGQNSWQGDCVICQYYSSLWKRSEDKSLSDKQREALQEKARQIKPVERYYYNVIVRQHSENKDQINAGPLIYACGKTVHEKILKAMTGDPKIRLKSLGKVWHPTEGRDFLLTVKNVRSGNKEYPNYDQSTFEQPTDLGDETQIKAWLDGLHDLQSLRVIKDGDFLDRQLKIHLGIIKEETNNGSNFNFADYETPDVVSGGSTVREELVRPTTPTVSSQSTPAADDDEIEVDEDFMKDLES